jgi:hypothetical protein
MNMQATVFKAAPSATVIIYANPLTGTLILKDARLKSNSSHYKFLKM